MTNNITRDTPTGTARFVPPAAGAGSRGNSLQLSSGEGALTPGQEPLPAVSGRWVSPRTRGSLRYGLKVTDLRGGLNMLRGPVEIAHTRLQDHTLEAHYRRTLSLPPATVTPVSSTAPTGTILRLSKYSQFGRLFLGIGSRASHALSGEGTGGDPTLTDVAYTPPGDILCMEPIFIGSSPTTERVMFGFYGAPAKIYGGSLAAPVLSATMDSSLSDCYGMIPTELNGYLMLFLTAGGIKTLARASGDTAAATTVLSNIPNPSKAIGLIKAAGGDIRAYWIWDNKLMHTDAEGGTPQQIDLGWGPLVDAVKHRDGAGMTNGSRIVYYNGRVFEDTYWQESRALPADLSYRLICTHLESNGLELIANVMLYDPAGVLPNYRWFESYNHELKHWYRRGGGPYATVNAVGVSAGQFTQGIAKSPARALILGGSGYVHARSGLSLHSNYFDDQLLDPLTRGNITLEQTGAATLAELLLPEPISEAPKTVDWMWYGGSMPGVDSGARVRIRVTGQDGNNAVSWTWRAPLSDRDRWKDFSTNQSRIINPVIDVTIDMQGGGYVSPNALPFEVGFNASLSEVKKRSWIGWK